MFSTACSPASALGNERPVDRNGTGCARREWSPAGRLVIAALGRDGPDLIGQPLEPLLRVGELIAAHLASPTRELSNERQELVQQLPQLDVAPSLARRRRTIGVTGAGLRSVHGAQAEAAADPARAVISWALARTVQARPRLAIAGSTMRAPRK